MKLRSKLFVALFFSSVLSLLSTKGFADGNYQYVKALAGSANQLSKDSVTEVADSLFFSSYGTSLVKPYNVIDVITFKIDEAQRVLLNQSFSANVKVRITLTKNGGSSYTIDTALTVTYNPADRSVYTNYSSLIFHDAYRVNVKILQTVTITPSLNVKAALVLQNQIMSYPRFVVDCQSKAVTNVVHNGNQARVDDELAVSWTNVLGADEYDLEWSYLDSSALPNYYTSSALDPEKIFTANSTRITTSDNTYNIPILYDTAGVLFVRARAVFNQDGHRLETAWSSDNLSNGLYSYGLKGHENSLNWQSSVTFAEDGKRKVVVQYFDGSLRSRQTVTKDNTSNTTVVAESFYDYQGRPVIQVLPAPTVSSIIQYTKNFNAGLNGAEYTKDNYDFINSPNYYCNAAAAVMDSSTGAANYYSASNPDVSTSHAYIPQAKGFAFTETEYTQDNTGRISRQGGVGPTFQLGSGHETKYYYGGAPAQEEVDALFGTEAGKNTHYFKNMVRDANGQFSVSYTDMHGRTVATALSGQNPATLDTISSYKKAVIKETLSDSAVSIVKDLVMETNKTLLVSKLDSFAFRYDLNPEVLQKNACDNSAVCYDCLYDLEIKITDDCNNQKNGTNGHPFDTVVHNFSLTGINADCSSPDSSFHLAFTRYLEPGSYQVTKKLSVSRYAINYYRDSVFMLKNICISLDSMIRLQARLRAGADCQANALGDMSPGDNGDIDTAMREDMSAPSGQYANPDKADDPYSIFYSDADANPPVLPVYQNLGITYKDENGKADKVFDDRTQTYVIPQLLDPEQFARKFKHSWAADLLPYHPEYCKLQKYNAFSSSLAWDRKVEKIDTYQEANSLGYLNPTAKAGVPPYNRYTVPQGANADPLAAMPGSYKSSLESTLTQFKSVDPNNANNKSSMWVIASLSARIQEGNSSIPAINDNNAFDPNWCAADLDMAWRSFRTFYLQAKKDIVFTAINGTVSGVTCTNVVPGAATLLAAGHTPNFITNTEALQTSGYSKAAAGTNVAAVQGEASDSLNKFYADNCKAYATQWAQQLSSCYSSTVINDSLVPKLIEVCKAGSDSDHPYGSRTVAPSSTNRFRSFDDVINDYNSRHSNTAGIIYCNADVITAPKPYDQQAVFANKPVYTKPSGCECTLLNQYRSEFLINKVPADNNSFSAYLSRKYHTTISDAGLNTLLSRCNTTRTCNYLETPIYLEPALQCNTGSICITCSVMATMKHQFDSLYPGITISLPETDTVQRNKNQLFANFMNNRLGFGKQAWEYINFLSQCGQQQGNGFSSARAAYSVNAMASGNSCDSISNINSRFPCYFNSLDDSVVHTGLCNQTYWTVNSVNGFNANSSSFITTDTAKIIKNGAIGFTPEGDTLAKGYITYQLLRNIRVNNNFTVEYRVKNSVQNCSNTCSGDLGLTVFNHSINGAGVSNDEDFYFDLTHVSGSSFYAYRHSNPIPASVLDNHDFNSYRVVKEVVSDTAFQVYYDSSLILSVHRDGYSVIDQIGGLQFAIWGNGSRGIDWVKISVPSSGTNQVVYYEDFTSSSHLSRPNPAYLVPKPVCSDAYAQLFNRTYNTNYSFGDLNAKSEASCGKPLTVCTSSFCDSISVVSNHFPCFLNSLDDSVVHTGLCNQKYWNAGASTGYTLNDHGYYTYEPREFISNGVMKIPSPADTMLHGGFRYDLLRNIAVNNQFTIEYRVKNVSGTDVALFFGNHSINNPGTTMDEDFYFDFANNGSGFYSYRHGNPVFPPGLQNHSFNSWQTVKMVASTDTFAVYLNDTAVLKVPRDKQSRIDQLNTFAFPLSGVIDRELDWVRISVPGAGNTSQVIYYDDFNNPDALSRPDPAFLVAKPSCSDAYAQLFNLTYNTNYTYSDLSTKSQAGCGQPLNICTPPAELTLCGKQNPVFGAAQLEAVDNCSDSTHFDISVATELYKVYTDSLKNNFDSLYRAKCLNAYKYESFTVTHPVSEYHYTLYYYDQAGNLVKTIPPAGIDTNTHRSAWLDSVKLYRITNRLLTPNHKLPTVYCYNSLNQVISQSTPDAGTSHFYYDRLGRLVLSQNAKQKSGKKYSYTQYDGIGRIAEVGELTGDTTMNTVLSRTVASLSSWLGSYWSSRTQVTKTWYDAGYVVSLAPYITQRNLRNRVGWTALYSTAAKADSRANFSAATFYTYDVHGNVDTLLQDYGSQYNEPNIMNSNGNQYVSNRFKRMVYQYDLVSGKVNTVAYQPPVAGQVQPDAFYHRYSYDAENRLTDVETSQDSIYWEKDAKYTYYKHGPLARLLMGQQQVQGVDYAYTLQGWLKGVNSTSLLTTADMGKDGTAGDAANSRAQDIFGFALHYYDSTDYQPIGNVKPFAAANVLSSGRYRPLYNGNIAATSLNLPSVGGAQLYSYSYDQLNRLIRQQVDTGLNAAQNKWIPVSVKNYNESISYDGNGNILTYNRYAGNNSGIMDSLRYAYTTGTNRLDSISDKVADGSFSGDIDNQSAHNYSYDAIGNMTADTKEGITSIDWTVYGKISKITKKNGIVITYAYDAAGNRISKIVSGKSGNPDSTWYVRDASGNVMAVYTKGNTAVNSGRLTQNEVDIYGSSRLGMIQPAVDVQNWVGQTTVSISGYGSNGYFTSFTRGQKRYELTNHLGNVLAVISDRKTGVVSGSTVSYYKAEVVSANDYYPFGMQQKERTYFGDTSTVLYSGDGTVPVQTPATEYMAAFESAVAYPYIDSSATLDSRITNAKWTNSRGAWTTYKGVNNSKALAISNSSATTTTLTLQYDVAAGYTASLDTFLFYQRSSNLGYAQWSMTINGSAAGSGNIFVDVANGDNPMQLTGKIAVATPLHNLTGHITIVITLSNGTGTNGSNSTFRLDNFTLIGYTVSSGIQNIYVHKNAYRYGFNGKENDNEVKGEGNEQDYGMRIYDSRLGKFLSVDPLTKSFPWYTPYQFSGNNPLAFTDLDGAELNFENAYRNFATLKIYRFDKLGKEQGLYELAKISYPQPPYMPNSEYSKKVDILFKARVGNVFEDVTMRSMNLEGKKRAINVNYGGGILKKFVPDALENSSVGATKYEMNGPMKIPTRIDHFHFESNVITDAKYKFNMNNTHDLNQAKGFIDFLASHEGGSINGKPTNLKAAEYGEAYLIYVVPNNYTKIPDEIINYATGKNVKIYEMFTEITDDGKRVRISGAQPINVDKITTKFNEKGYVQAEEDISAEYTTTSSTINWNRGTGKKK